MLRKASNPKVRMIIPDILFTIANEALLNCDLKKPTPVLRISHHIAEPSTTPTTINTADKVLPLEFANPSPAKTAMNDKIVVGFVSVRKTVER